MPWSCRGRGHELEVPGRVALAIELVPGGQLVRAVEVEPGEDLPGEVDRCDAAGGDQVAVGHGTGAAEVLGAAVADAGQHLEGVAGVGPVVEQTGGGEADGGSADGGHRGTGGQERPGLLDEAPVA